MKKIFIAVSILVLASTSCQTGKEDNTTALEENKKISTLYHERNLEDVDKLLSEDFVGIYYSQGPKPNTWDKEDHKNAIIKSQNVKDSILIQIAEDDWIAEQFIRTFKNEDTIIRRVAVQFKQIKNGKIVSSWELFNPID